MYRMRGRGEGGEGGEREGERGGCCNKIKNKYIYIFLYMRGVGTVCVFLIILY